MGQKVPGPLRICSSPYPQWVVSIKFQKSSKIAKNVFERLQSDFKLAKK